MSWFQNIFQMSESKQPANPNEYYKSTKVNVLSPWLKEEVKRAGGINGYISCLLTIEHYITTGDDRATYDGLSIPWFSQHHPSQMIEQYKMEYKKIYNDLKDFAYCCLF